MTITHTYTIVADDADEYQTLLANYQANNQEIINNYGEADAWEITEDEPNLTITVTRNEN